MGRYPSQYKNSRGKKTMWRYVALSHNLKKRCFSQFWLLFAVSRDFQKNSGGTVWRYVALSRNLKNDAFLYFCYFLLFPGIFKKAVVALCGAMWRYVALSRNLKKR